MTPASLTSACLRTLYVCLVFLGTMEVTARAEARWRWGAPFWGPYSSERLRFTDEIGTRNRPGARFEKWAINSAGFRGPEVRFEKHEGVMRIGVAGASEVFGLYESPGKDLVAQVRARLDVAAPGRFEVVNLASAGMSPPRIRELIERWAGRFAFDVIVVYPTPAFYLEIAAPERARRPVASPEPTNKARLTLRLPDKAWQAGRQQLPLGLQAWMKRVGIQRARRAHPPEWVWTEAPPERVERFAEDMGALVDAIERAGARPVLAAHAHRFALPMRDTESDQMDGWIRFYPRATAECLLDMERRANETLAKISERRRIPLVDLQRALGKDPRHYADFSHFTDEGAAVAAESLVAVLLSVTAG